jgi:hypothetical protein
MFDHINEAANITYRDVVTWFGDWAEVWPNSRVVKATAKTKGVGFGLLGHYTEVRISGGSLVSTLVLWSPLEQEEWVKQVLKKAFGSRFVKK